MKAILSLSLLASIAPMHAQVSVPVTPEATVQENLSPNQQAFLNLPEDRRKEFVKSLTEANRLFGQKRIFETLEELDKTTKIFPDSPEILNLRGSCYVEMRAFDKAADQFQKASDLSPNNPSIEFNVAEVLFVTKQWQKANDLYVKLLKAIPASNLPLARLVEFKLMLCKNKLGLANEVTILAEKYDFLDDSPYYYYAKAALAYEAKNPVKAEEWLQIASRIFQAPEVLAPWQDTMVEFGYIKSFYGEDESAE